VWACPTESSDSSDYCVPEEENERHSWTGGGKTWGQFFTGYIFFHHEYNMYAREITYY
jgi:hypothetical protein